MCHIRVSPPKCMIELLIGLHCAGCRLDSYSYWVMSENFILIYKFQSKIPLEDWSWYKTCTRNEAYPLGNIFCSIMLVQRICDIAGQKRRHCITINDIIFWWIVCILFSWRLVAHSDVKKILNAVTVANDSTISMFFVNTITELHVLVLWFGASGCLGASSLFLDSQRTGSWLGQLVSK